MTETEKHYYTAVGLVLHKEFKNDQGEWQQAKFFATGTLIHPQVVLTAAHCLKDTKSVGITLDEKIPQGEDSSLISTKRYVCHPNYENTNHRLDFGLIFLPCPLQETGALKYPVPVPFVSQDLPQNYIRYGYGGREQGNVRFRTEMKFSLENKAGFVLSEDTTGVYGDSGGPVFVARNGELHLIGIHTGREKDPETRELKDRSFMTPLTPALIIWIRKTIQDLTPQNPSVNFFKQK